MIPLWRRLRVELFSNLRGNSIVALGSLLAVTTLTLGMVGWLRAGESIGDSLYRSLLAFMVDPIYAPDAAEDGGRLSLPLQIARFTGFSTTFVTIFGLFVIGFSHRIRRWVAARRTGHAVLVGATPFALEWITREAPDRRITVIGGVDAGIPQGRGVICLADDPEDANAAAALIGRPAKIMFGARETVRNIARARALAAPGAEVSLRVEDISLVRDLSNVAPDLAHATPVSSSEHVAEIFVHAIAASEMSELRGQSGVHVVLVGLGSTGLAIAEQLAATCHHPSALQKLRITVLDRAASAAQLRAESQSPGLFSVADIRFVEMEGESCLKTICTDRLMQIEAEQAITAIVVATGDDARNAAIAMRFRQLQLERLVFKAPIFVRNRMRTGRAPDGILDLSGGLYDFGGDRGAETDPRIRRFEEALAEAQHTVWARQAQVEWETGLRASRPIEWEALSSAARRSSLLAARASPHMLRAIGLIPDVGGAFSMRLDAGAVAWAREQTGTLEILEHERWMAEKKLDGYKPALPEKSAPGRRDDERKLHPDLVPWDALPPASKDKDTKNIDLMIDFCRDWPGRDTSWRRRFRIGVMGPLRINSGDAARIRDAITAHFATGVSDMPLSGISLEILTPDAPGVDRVAATEIALAWREATGRDARLVSLRAAGLSVLDERAVTHLLRDSAADRRVFMSGLAAAHAQSKALEAAARGHVSIVDMRPSHLSDADLLDDTEAFHQSVERVSSHIDSLSDLLICAMRDGEGARSRRTFEAREATGRSCLRIDLDPGS